MSNDLCQECNKFPATYEAIFTIDGRNITKNVCDRCYNKMYLSAHELLKNIYTKLNEGIKEIIFKARQEARNRRHKEITDAHLLYAICTEQNFVIDILKSLGKSPGQIKAKADLAISSIVDLLERGSRAEPDISQEVKSTLEKCNIIIDKLDFQEITPEILFLAILEGKTKAQEILKKEFGLDVYIILKEMEAQLDGSHDLVKKYKESKEAGKSALEKFSRDLNKLSLEGKLDPCIGRELEVDRLIHILSRRTKNNCVLVGEPGVGKSCLAEGLAQKIVEYKVPKNLLDKKVLALDLNAMIAGTRMRGDFEERIKAVIDEVKANSRKIILFIDELHSLIGAGGNGNSDAANILKPALARGEMQCIGATTYDEYSQYIESDRALERRFQKLDICEPTIEDTKKILHGIKNNYAKFHEVSISDEAIESAVDMSVRYVPSRFLPDKAIDLLDEASAAVKLTQLRLTKDIVSLREQILIKKKNKEDVNKLEIQLKDKVDFISTKKDLTVEKNDIANVVSKWIGVPTTDLLQEEKEKLINLENILHKTVIGQDLAIKSLCDAIRRSRVGITNQNRPITSVIFAGKTGVGKTLIAQTIAKQLFGNKENFIKLDMSEYQEKHEVSKLIGAPPGYVGYEKGGQLVEHIRRHPYSVVLFDEIEKAHLDVFNSLLQIMEDGVLTDGKGRKADFRNTIIIMTSNIAASEKIVDMGFISKTQEDSYERLKDRTENALKHYFRPEFLNRVDDILIFHELNEKDINQIVDIQLDELKNRITDYKLQFDDLTKFIAKNAFSKDYGARSIRRWIQKNIENELAKYILENDVKKDSEINIIIENEKIKIK